MKKKMLWLILSCLMTLSLVMASCGGEEEEEEEVTVPETKEEVTVTEEEEEEEVVPQTGIIPWWKTDPTVEPQYGGSFNIMGRNVTNFDPYFQGRDYGGTPLWYDSIMRGNWTGVPPEECDFKTISLPGEYYTPYLAESVEYEDYTTVIFHFRKGVHFHNIPPVNGRELTAYDVEYCVHRITGMGSGYTEPSPWLGINLLGELVSVTATDKYTLVIEMAEPSVSYTRSWLQGHPCYFSIYPPEIIEEHGDLQDWENQIGTGPFILKDYIESSAYTSVRNPDYWDYDEHYPQNQLPYVDEIKSLIIPDIATARSALRTGKIDFMGRVDWENTDSIMETNPELSKRPSLGMAGIIAMQVDVKPFDDIRVRQALQKAINLEELAVSFYGGFWDGTPVGFIGTVGPYDNWMFEYDDWPQEVKDGYSFDPERAKELLAEAGYPDGFKCTLDCSSSYNLDLLQIIQAYWKDIGVDMSINTMEPVVARSYGQAGKAVMSAGLTASFFSFIYPPDMTNMLVASYTDYPMTHVDDPIFEELNLKIQTTLDPEELRLLCRDADRQIISRQTAVSLVPTVSFTLVQPWIKRYADIATMNIGAVYARLWIDQELKRSMGK